MANMDTLNRRESGAVGTASHVAAKLRPAIMRHGPGLMLAAAAAATAEAASDDATHPDEPAPAQPAQPQPAPGTPPQAAAAATELSEP